MSVGELLFEFTGEAGEMLARDFRMQNNKYIPLLDFVPALEERDWHEDDDSFPAMADFNLRRS